ncbi:MAG: hypothetical protein Q7S45_02025 [Candidatus Curtissbacteria bacterium]|nr:hypothetical protein [Candidatus Curtissbacteria bacterium]
MDNNQRVIIHADLNSFFATAEQQTNPALRGKPVGVIKAPGRTCIIAASVEAKKFGVGTGSRVYDAKKLCPEIILVPANFSKYEKMTYRFIDICKTYSPACEVFSLDECFIDVTETEFIWPRPPRNASLEQLAWLEMGKALRGNAGGKNVFNIAFEIKDRLRREVGDYMTCSVGVSHNRFLAKLASSQIKPDGLFWITDDNKLEVLDRSKLTDVCGLGDGLYQHLTRVGIDSFPILRAKSITFLQEHFGPHWSLHLYNLARGIDDSGVGSILEIPDAKSVGRTYTTHRNLYRKEEVWRLTRNLCEETAAKARKMHLAGRYVGFCLRGGPARIATRQQLHSSGRVAGGEVSEWGHLTLKNYINDGKILFDLCLQISKNWNFFQQPFDFAQVFDSEVAQTRGGLRPYVRFCGVTLGMLTKSAYLPSPLFVSDSRRVDLIKTIDKVNGKYGDYTIYPGQLLGTSLIRPEVNGFFGDRKYRLDFASKN